MKSKRYLINEDINYRFRDSVEVSFWESVYDSVDFPVVSSVRDSVYDSVWRSVRASVRRLMGSSLKEQK